MLWTTRSAVAVRETTFSVALLRAALPRPSGSAPVSCRYTGHVSSQVFTIRTLPPRADSGTPTAGSVRKPSAAALALAAHGDDGTEHEWGRHRQHPPDQQPLSGLVTGSGTHRARAWAHTLRSSPTLPGEKTPRAEERRPIRLLSAVPGLPTV